METFWSLTFKGWLCEYFFSCTRIQFWIFLGVGVDELGCSLCRNKEGWLMKIRYPLILIIVYPYLSSSYGSIIFICCLKSLNGVPLSNMAYFTFLWLKFSGGIYYESLVCSGLTENRSLNWCDKQISYCFQFCCPTYFSYKRSNLFSSFSNFLE